MKSPVLAVPVARLVMLRSGEADLVCAAGHISGHPYFCPTGCILIPTSGLVYDALPLKDRHAVGRLARLMEAGNFPHMPPVKVEKGWLLDGHHRVAAAVVANMPSLLAVEMNGILAEQQNWHAGIRRKAAPVA